MIELLYVNSSYALLSDSLFKNSIKTYLDRVINCSFVFLFNFNINLGGGNRKDSS